MWKALWDYKVARGKIKDRVWITFETEDGKFQLYLTPDEAEQIAAEIFAARFETGRLEVIAPRKKRRKASYIEFVSVPIVWGQRPMDFPKHRLDELDPAERERALAGRAKERWESARTKEGKRAKEGSRLIPKGK